MRKNRTKHEAKKPRLAKRALALCFALIFVCSCLLPAFAHSEGNLLAGTAADSTVVEQKDEQQPEEPVLLNESGENPTEEPKNEEPKPVEPEQKPEEPKIEETKPEGTTEGNEQPKTEGTTEESKNTTGETKPEETKPEEPKTEETKPEEPKTEESKDTAEETKTEETKPEQQPTTNTTGDTINQGEATYTYRFWPDKIDTFELEAINDAVKKGGETLNDAAQSRAGMVPCTVLTVMTNANLRDYQANVQQPTKDGYEFAGWYTVDGTTEDEFSFEQNLNFEESQTIDVFAKWNELVTLQTTVTVDVDATLFGGEAAISLADEYSYEDDRMAAPTKTLTLDVKATNLSSNSELSVTSASSSAIEDYCDNNDLVPILTLDITPKDKVLDKKTEPQGTSTVTISGLSELELPDKLTMVHKKDNGTIETIPAQYSNGTLTFKATSFSTYAVAAALWEWEPYTSKQYVYVYLKITGDTSGLVKHTNSSGNWFLIGRIPNVSLPYPDTGTYGDHKGQTAYSGKYQKAAVDALNKIERNGDGAVAANFSTAEAAKAAILANSGIDLKNVTWTGSNLGLTVGSGADGFVKKGNTWHLDGTLDIAYVDSYTINYLVEGTNEQIKDPYRANATVGTEINISHDDTLKPPTITENGKTYQLVSGDPENYRITVEKDGYTHGKNVINLYYRDISKSYPLFVYARISDTVYKKLHGLTLNANQWYTLGVVDKSGLSEPTGDVDDQDKKDRTSEKYNTAVSSLNDIVRYKDNQEIDLSWVEWDYEHLVDGVSFGLTKAKGADGYADLSTKSYTNKDGIETTKDTLSYHLDGYIPSIGAVVINYYIKGTDTPLQASVIHYGRTGSYYTLTSSEKPTELSKDGLTYELDEDSIDPIDKTQPFIDGDVKTIKLYYVAKTNLTVTKTATKDGNADNDTDFNFTLTLGSASEGVTWTKGTESDTVTGTSYPFTLKGGERITFSGINVNDTAVKVKEVDVDSHCTTKYKINNGTEETDTEAAISTTTLKEHQNSGGTTVDFVNVYTTPKLNSMTIKKKVTGAFGERTKEFTFSVKLDNTNPALLNGVTASGVVTSKDVLGHFTMNHGKSVTLGEIPIGTTITITESEANEYKTSATGHKNPIKTSGERTFTYTVMEEAGVAVLKSVGDDSEGFDGTAITVENNFDGNPDTGVLLDTLPYLILLAVAVAGGVLVVVRKHKHRDE